MMTGQEPENRVAATGEPVRQNAGFRIFDSIRIGGVEIVVGENARRTQYVTWLYTPQSQYLWGHYFTDKKKALSDFYRRAEEELRAQKYEKTGCVRKRESRDER